jgi:hypothetical protein
VLLGWGKFKNEKIEYYKLPAATSLSTQPLDLMKSFMMMRKFSKDYKIPNGVKTIPVWSNKKENI